MKERLLSMLATAGLVVGLAVILLPISQAWALGGDYTCKPNNCKSTNGICETGGAQTGTCVPDPDEPGNTCSGCLQANPAGCKCTKQ